MADVRVQVKPPAGAEPRHASRRKPTEREAAVLAHYPATYRRELLRRLRAKELWIRPDGLLGEVDAETRERARAQVAAAGRRQETVRSRRRTAAAARAKNRRRSR